MTRGGLKEKSVGQRHCRAEGGRKDRAALIRFVLSPENRVVPDLSERLGGRGVWIGASQKSLIRAVEKNEFSRGFKTEAKIPENFLEDIEALLVQRLISLISLARRAGKAFSGKEKVSQILKEGKACVLIQAYDGSEREKRNLSFRSEIEARYECLSQNELGLAFSKDIVVHAALTGEGLTNRVKEESIRLSLLRNRELLKN